MVCRYNILVKSKLFKHGDMSIWLDNVIKELVTVLFMFVIFQCLHGYFGSVLFFQHGDMSIC